MNDFYRADFTPQIYKILSQIPNFLHLYFTFVYFYTPVLP